MRKTILILLFSMFLLPLSASTHCQIPCGIYDDDARFHMMEEDLRTVEKSMNMIMQLSEKPDADHNQIVRWVNNKEHHADKISETVTYYFMAQRIEPVGKEAGDEEYAAYARKLELLHQMVVYSMKAKQSTDLSYVEKMRVSLEEFRALYFKQ